MQQINAFINNRFMQKHGLKIAWAIALLCLCWMLIYIGMTVRNTMQTRASNYSVQEIQPINKSRKAPYRVRQIIDADLFGDPTPQAVVQKAPKTTLDLTLQGILWASDNSISRAIIQSGRKDSDLYSIGEKINGAGAEIREIRAAEVILNRNGAAESLPLVKSEDSGNRQIITYSNTEDEIDSIADSLDGHGSGDTSNNVRATNRAARDAQDSASVREQRSNGKGRKLRKPNFSGLDRALKKLEEI